MSRVKGYPCVGGPLDGQLAREADFYTTISYGNVHRPGGKFEDYRDQYHGFNRASSYYAAGAPPTRIWLHKGLLPK